MHKTTGKCCQRHSTGFAFACLGILLASVCCWPALSYAQHPQDPWEAINRPIYQFNQVLDGYLIRPVTICYTKVLPDFAKRAVSNFFDNLDDVNVVVNDVLQGKLKLAAEDTGRLALNSTVGLGGLIDVATHVGWYKHNEDFGQTLGHWGLGSGPYMVLPLLGASTLRDTAGLVPDSLLNPVLWDDKQTRRRVGYVMDTIDTRLGYLAAETLIRGDEYSFVRNAYLLRREYLVADGMVTDDFDDF